MYTARRHFQLAPDSVSLFWTALDGQNQEYCGPPLRQARCLLNQHNSVAYAESGFATFWYTRLVHNPAISGLASRSKGASEVGTPQ